MVFLPFWGPIKCVEIPIFTVLFEHQPKFGQNMAKKKDNFSHLAKHRFIKKRFVATPPFSNMGVFFNLSFLKAKTLMFNKNTNQNRKKKQRQEKGI